MYVFWRSVQAKSQGNKPLSLEDNKNVLDGNELTHFCTLRVFVLLRHCIFATNTDVLFSDGLSGI